MKHEYEGGLYGLRHMPAHLEGICRSVYGVCQQLQQVFRPHLAMLLLVVPILPHCLISKNTILSSCDDWTTRTS